MKRTLAFIICLLMCLSTAVFTVPAGAEDLGKNLLLDATYVYVEDSNGFLNSCTDTSCTVLNDGKVRGEDVEFDDMYGVPGTTVELVGTYSSTIIEFTLKNPSHVNCLVFRGVRRNGNRYLNIVDIQVAGETGSYSSLSFEESSVAIQDAPYAPGTTDEQYFDITATFADTALDVKKIKVELNTQASSGYKYVVSFDELEAYGFSTGSYKVGGTMALSGSTTVATGSTFTVNAYVNAITAPNGLVACDLPLVYDKTKLQLVSAEPIVPANWAGKTTDLSSADKSAVPCWLSVACTADDLLTNDAYYVKADNSLGFALTFRALAAGEAVISVDNDLASETFVLAVDAVGFVNYGVTGATHTVTVSGDAVRTYTVNYNANGGTGAPSAQTKIEGDALTLSTVVPTRDGFVFEGWATSSDFTVVAYAAGARYTADADVTLYAVWSVDDAQPNKYTVSYNANGGTGAPSAQTKTEGEALTLSTVVPTRDGFVFAGWATSSTSTAVAYPAGARYTADADVTLYAVWNSAGQEYAVGDVNYDDHVDNIDAAYVLRYDAELTDFDAITLLVADANKDGNVDSLDAATILKYDAGLITEDFGTITVD